MQLSLDRQNWNALVEITTENIAALLRRLLQPAFAVTRLLQHLLTPMD
jgi:hypothetical protein